MPRDLKFLNKVPFEDVEYNAVEGEEIVLKNLTAAAQKRIVRQANEEYDVCFPYVDAKRKQNLQRLRLFNNQRRDPGSVGDTLLFTVFMTIHAALYDDRMMSVWKG